MPTLADLGVVIVDNSKAGGTSGDLPGSIELMPAELILASSSTPKPLLLDNVHIGAGGPIGPPGLPGFVGPAGPPGPALGPRGDPGPAFLVCNGVTVCSNCLANPPPETCLTFVPGDFDISVKKPGFKVSAVKVGSGCQAYLTDQAGNSMSFQQDVCLKTDYADFDEKTVELQVRNVLLVQAFKPVPDVPVSVPTFVKQTDGNAQSVNVREHAAIVVKTTKKPVAKKKAAKKPVTTTVPKAAPRAVMIVQSALNNHNNVAVMVGDPGALGPVGDPGPPGAAGADYPATNPPSGSCFNNSNCSSQSNVSASKATTDSPELNMYILLAVGFSVLMLNLAILTHIFGRAEQIFVPKESDLPPLEMKEEEPLPERLSEKLPEEPTENLSYEFPAEGKDV